MAQGAGQGAGHGRPGQDAAPPRRCHSGQPAAAYAWHVAPGGVLVVVDLDRDGQRSVTNDAAGVVSDLAKMRPDLLARVPLVPHQNSMGRWDAVRQPNRPRHAARTSAGISLKARRNGQS